MKSSWLPMQIRILQDDGIPKDTMICTIPHTGFWLEFKKYQNGRFRVAFCEPNKDRKRIVAPSASIQACKRLLDFSCLPHKTPQTDVQILTSLKRLISKRKMAKMPPLG